MTRTVALPPTWRGVSPSPPHSGFFLSRRASLFPLPCYKWSRRPIHHPRPRRRGRTGNSAYFRRGRLRASCVLFHAGSRPPYARGPQRSIGPSAIREDRQEAGSVCVSYQVCDSPCVATGRTSVCSGYEHRRRVCARQSRSRGTRATGGGLSLQQRDVLAGSVRRSCQAVVLPDGRANLVRGPGGETRPVRACLTRAAL